MTLSGTVAAMSSGGQVYVGAVTGRDTALLVRGFGYDPGSRVALYWDGAPVGMVTADANGGFEATIAVPAQAPAGDNMLTAEVSPHTLSAAGVTVVGGAPAIVAPHQHAAHAPSGASPHAEVTARATTSNGCTISAGDQAGERYVLNLLNQHRAAVGVAALRLNPTLAGVSRQHSCDMFRHQQLSHTGSDGSSPFDRISRAGIAYTTAGENIGMASGYGLYNGLSAIDSQMMSEPTTPGTHHWNIVNAGYSQVGVGVIYQNGQVWVTEDFIG